VIKSILSVAVALLLTAAVSSCGGGLPKDGSPSITEESERTDNDNAVIGGSSTGSGRAVTQDRQVPPFTAVTLTDAGTVRVQHGPNQKVTVTFDDNLISRLRTDVSGTRLTISVIGSYSSRVGPVVDITMPSSLMSADLDGSGDVTATGVNSERFSAEVRGSGKVTAAGRADRVDARVTGSGGIAMPDLVATDVNVRVEGSGEARVSCSGVLSAAIIGSGDIRYRGAPTQIQRDVTGSGSVSVD